MKYLILIFTMMVACGMDKEKTCQEDASKCEKVEPLETSSPYFTLSGSVVGAFDIEVDGQGYADIEAFFSEENARLTARIVQAGYVGYTAKLEGKIGFKDLTSGMTVFVAPQDNRGYAARTVVLSNDTFSIRFPEDAAYDVYKVKATKRINVKLTKLSEDAIENENALELVDTKLLCYNFSAIDVAVSYEEVNEPIVLNSFETKLTEYACEDVAPSETLDIPNAE